jgi:hypothetical protein
MRKSLPPILAAAMLAAALLSACNSTTPVTTETTPPTISFRSTGTGCPDSRGPCVITSLSANADGPASVFFTALANDTGGVKSMDLSFSTQVAGCTDTKTTTKYDGPGAVYNYTPVPASQNQTSSPGSNGQLPTELFTMTQLQGPYTCVVGCPPICTTNAATRPYGQTIYAIVTATNSSGKSSTGRLPITFTSSG